MKHLFFLLVTICILSAQLKAQNTANPFPCYTVSENPNTLFEFNPSTQTWTNIGEIDPVDDLIEAIATDPINNIIYAYDAGKKVMGIIDPNLANPTQFTPIDPENIGKGVGTTANGDYATVINPDTGAPYGAITLNDIDGLTYDPVNEVLYGTHRIYSGSFCNPILNTNDLLFKIDISNGNFIPGAMLDGNGNPADYAVIEQILSRTKTIDNPLDNAIKKKSIAVDTCNTKGFYYDVEDIAYNPYTGELYAIQTQEDAIGSLITVLNSVSGEVEALLYEDEENIYKGLGFSYLGQLYATLGEKAANNNYENGFVYFNLTNQSDIVLPKPDASNTFVNFEAFDCLTGYNDLALSYTFPAGSPSTYSKGSDLTLLLNVYNQGKITNASITIANYKTEGLTLNDVDWNSSNNFYGDATYTIPGKLNPGDFISVPITFTIDADFEGEEITTAAEISSSFMEDDFLDVTGKALEYNLPDFDSWPDDYNGEPTDVTINGASIPIVDNKIDGGGPNANQDEDDHDIAIIKIDDNVVTPTNPIAFPCYTVNEDGGSDPNNLFEFNPVTQIWTNIGEIDPIGDLIEAIATDPINDIIYAYDAGKDVLGIIDPNAADNRTLFTAIGIEGEGVGTANGDYKAVKLDDVDGLTFDPVNMILYGAHRIRSGDICNPDPNTNDVLFQIDISTGKFVPGAMLDSNGNPADYAIIEEVVDETANDPTICPIGNAGGGFVYDVDDIAYNPYTGELFALQNQDGPGTLTSIDPANGNLRAIIYDIDKDDVESLGFDYFGSLYATTGDPGSGGNEFIYLDTKNQSYFLLPYPDPTGTFVDFEAFDCFTAFNDLALSYTVAPGAPFNIEVGDEIKFLANIYNQGDFTNTNITIINYIPNGLTLLAGQNWVLDNNGNATYTITEKLAPGGLITVPINFIVDAGFEGEIITSAAEITGSFGVDLVSVNGNTFERALPDVDSYPDFINDDYFIKDNKINGAGPNAIPQEDEDDHDTAAIKIADFNAVESLTVITTLNSAQCGSFGAAEIKIFGNSTPPYTYKMLDPLGSLVHLETSNNPIHQITGLPVGNYYVIVTDAAGKISPFIIVIYELAENNGNLNCSNNCPEFLTTTNNLLSGTFQAEEVIEIKGFVNGSQNTLFSICE